MSAYHDEMRSIMKQKRTIYHSPLPMKTQRVASRKGRNGPVKVFSRKEILRYIMEKVKNIV